MGSLKSIKFIARGKQTSRYTDNPICREAQKFLGIRLERIEAYKRAEMDSSDGKAKRE